MKKIIALILTVVMMAGILTGCGLNEIGYLDMISKTNKIQVGSATSETTIKFDMKTIKNMVWELAAGAITVEELDAMKINGSKIKIWAESKYDTKDKSTKDTLCDLNISVAWENNPKMELLTLKMGDNKVYISQTYLENMAKLVSQIIDLGGNTNSLYATLIPALQKEFVNEKYILVSDLVTVTNVDDQDIIQSADIMALVEISEKYFKDICSGFNNTVVKKIGSGYEIEMNAQKALDLTKGFAKYLSDNKEVVFGKLIKMIKEITSLVKTEKDLLNVVAESIETQKITFFNILDAISNGLNTVNSTTETLNKVVSDMSDSNIKYSITNDADLFNATMDAKIAYKKAVIMEIKSKSSMRELNQVNIEKPMGTIIPIKDYSARAQKVYETVNPVKKMEIPWKSAKVQGLTDIAYERQYNGQTGSVYYFLKNDTLYLPLRTTCETFNESVNWDNDLKQSYILRGTEKIYLEGLLIESKTYLKIRDFEKIGYKIDYTGKDGDNKVTIEKNNEVTLEKENEVTLEKENEAIIEK